MRSWFGFLELYKNGQFDKPNILHYLNKEEYFMISFPKNAFSIKTGNVRLGISTELMKKVPNAKKLLTFKIPNILKIRKILHSKDTYSSDVRWEIFQN
jgi:hypothetical protein